MASNTSSDAAQLEDLRTHYADLDITDSISDVSTHHHGFGGYADIYTALWTQAGMNLASAEPIAVAVKRLRVYVGSGIDSGVIRSLRQEISVWRRLEHPNVQKLHGLWWGSPNLFPGMVSTWEGNGDINNYLRNLPPTIEEHELFTIKLSLLKDVLEGLIYLHRQEVIHGDLKGANILVGRYGNALLTDFGIAWTLVKNSQSFTANRDPKGSTRWMAPEFFADSVDDQGLYTPASDSWAFGCLFLEIYSGLPPYFKKKRDQHVILALSKKEGPCRPENMDDQLWATVEYCCTLNVEHRPTAAETFVKLQQLRELWAHNDTDTHTDDLPGESQKGSPWAAHSPPVTPVMHLTPLRITDELPDNSYGEGPVKWHDLSPPSNAEIEPNRGPFLFGPRTPPRDLSNLGFGFYESFRD